MPVFKIEQFELHSLTYRIEAADVAEAIVKVLDGEAEPVEQTHNFDIADDYGLPADDHRELADALRTQGVPVDSVIPSIHGIEMVR